MSIPRLLTTAFALIAFQFLSAQPICGFDRLHNQRLTVDAAYRTEVKAIESSIRQTIQQNDLLKQNKGPKTLAGPPYTIPVVVHVVHTGGAIGSIYNPTDAQIQGAIDYLNQVYNGSYPGITGAGDLGIQFALAQRDPNCNATSGIDRVDGSVIANYATGGVNYANSTGTDEVNVKNLVRWDPTQYYNVWVVDKIDGADGTSGTFIAGFAYFPGAGPVYDGTVMLATQMIAGQKTLPHEIGHAFNLYHPFEGSPDKNTCPVNTSCSINGDQVCDTDPITYNQLAGAIDFTCRTGINTCTGIAYSNSTESNFMNYTFCYNLFTAGQKTRMQASAVSAGRLSLTNSLGATAPDQGATPCIPKVNFSTSGDNQKETTSASSGCRNYKDYAYTMVIGKGPSVTATALLSVNSGTATEGVDFDLTTNGSFATPSKTVTFPANSITTQSFTIRIYDDASVESTETAVIGFTVNGNGGDALAGNGIPNFTLTITDNDDAPTAGSTPSATVTLGVASGTLNAAPFNATLQSQKLQIQYKAAELTAAGIPAGYISSLSLNVQSKLTTRSFAGLTISLGKSSASYLVNGATVTTGSAMTVVKTMSSYTTVAGWNDFLFDAPYLWDGTSNLVVEFCYDNLAASAGSGIDVLSSFLDGGTPTQGNFILQNNINCGQSFSTVSFYGMGRKPVTKFLYGIAPTPVSSTLNVSQTAYLGANADIYFYDSATSQLMARIQNGAFDYGCTQVQIDRAGTGATAFWNNTPANYLFDKTFRVIPTTNHAGGDYTITLYYTAAEVAGWQTATGQSVNTIQLVKATNAISSVTPGNVAPGGTIVTGPAAVSTLGTNTGLSYHFTTGFSGFGAGIIGVVLPIRDLHFTARLDGKLALLNWSTSSELNTFGFDVERSYDGIHFEPIAFVAAAGNSSTEKDYSYTDHDAPRALAYYRIKSRDLDNRFEYSAVRQVKYFDDQKRFTLLNNPFHNSITLQWSGSLVGQARVRLLDVTGKELYRWSFGLESSDHRQLDLSAGNISQGVYLLEITTAKAVQVERVLKQ